MTANILIGISGVLGVYSIFKLINDREYEDEIRLAIGTLLIAMLCALFAIFFKLP